MRLVSLGSRKSTTTSERPMRSANGVRGPLFGCAIVCSGEGGGKLEFRHEATDYFSLRIVLLVGLMVFIDTVNRIFEFLQLFKKPETHKTPILDDFVRLRDYQTLL